MCGTAQFLKEPFEHVSNLPPGSSITNTGVPAVPGQRDRQIKLLGALFQMGYIEDANKLREKFGARNKNDWSPPGEQMSGDRSFLLQADRSRCRGTGVSRCRGSPPTPLRTVGRMSMEQQQLSVESMVCVSL